MEEILKILVVDDDEVDRIAVRRALKAADFQIELTEVSTCTAAIAVLQNQQFDCVFIDFRLPDGDGLSLVRATRRAHVQAPLVILTGQGDEQTAVQVMKAGASDYLLKDQVAAGNLSQIIRNVVRLHRAEIEAQQANRKLQESEERFRLVLEGSGDGIWDWDIVNDQLYWNDRLLEIAGLDRAEFGGTHQAFLALVHPEDQEHLRQAVQAHLDQTIEFNPEFRLRHSSGAYRDCIARGKVQRQQQGTPVRMAGIVSDITERKRARQAVTESEERFRTMADSAPVLLWLVGENGLRSFFNQAWLAFTGRNLAQELGNGWLSSLHSEDQQAYLQAYLSTFKLHQPFETEYRLKRADGEYRWILATDSPRFLPDGSFAGYIGSGIDITERKRTEEAQRFLAEASSILSASLDYEVTLENLAQLAVPYLADYCVVEMLQGPTSLQLVAVAHVKPAKIPLVRELRRVHPLDPYSDHDVARVLRSGQPELVKDISACTLTSYASSPEHLQLLQKLDPKSYMIVPLVARGRTLGVISFISAESGRSYSEANLTLAEDLARRAALAVDNARLYRQAQDVGENLRRAIMVLGEQQQQLRTLQQLTNLLNQRLSDLPELLQLMVQAVCEAIPGGQFCLIALYKQQYNLLELTATAGINRNDLPKSHLYIEGGILGQVFSTGESQLIQEEILDFRIQGQGIASICAVPIQSAQSGRLGVLAIGNWDDSAAFSEENRILMIAFGEQAAIALNNAQLINALEEREERLESQNQTLGRQNRELEHQRQQIQLQNLKLIEATQLKSQFLATMSHELRTPMNAITGFSQLLLRQRHSQLDPKQTDMVERILSNGKNLLTLINDILDLSKIEAGRLELNLEAFDLPELVTETVAELQSLADQKNLPVELQVNLADPRVVNDRLRLRQILINLLSNAIKFTEAGRVVVCLETLKPDQIEITVEDNGIGIDQTHLKNIFSEFWQVDQTTTRRYAGTGLGLAITARLVRMMQGTISVQSQLGEGSRFRIEVPRQVCLPSSLLA